MPVIQFEHHEGPGRPVSAARLEVDDLSGLPALTLRAAHEAAADLAATLPGGVLLVVARDADGLELCSAAVTWSLKLADAGGSAARTG